MNASTGLLGAANDAREDDDEDVEIVEAEGSDGEIRLRGIGLYGFLPALFVEGDGQNTPLSGSESSSILASTADVATFVGTEENRFARIDAGLAALLVVRPVDGVAGTRSSSESARMGFDDAQDFPLTADGVDRLVGFAVGSGMAGSRFTERLCAILAEDEPAPTSPRKSWTISTSASILLREIEGNNLARTVSGSAALFVVLPLDGVDGSVTRGGGGSSSASDSLSDRVIGDRADYKALFQYQTAIKT